MIVGKVVGSVVSTRKNEKLIGNKFMIVEPVHHMKGDLSQIVAIDIIGAGIGEYVLVAQGSAAELYSFGSCCVPAQSFVTADLETPDSSTSLSMV